ncbi:acyltransferase [Escherichia coli]|nr:acyltransferase [Escherichia coli]EFB7232985.1 acyltransferase [Escherichia coli]EFH8159385.1 acyltransferase family protein [Escherichia coli]EFN6675163.1 acyltransferase [Escherichia coli]EFU6092826.1 acyltransferase [Escherichia coli]
MTNVFGKRIYTLDVLRGFAALSVVLWHWQHFFMKNNAASGIIINRQPFYEFFFVFYHYGLYAVELFFVISGFIFFYLYADNIHSNKTSAKTFIVNRVSRLYPLYIFTFAVVAILQIIFFKSHNYFFVYPMNDIYHAILNLLMIQSWGFERGWSFNAPTWSVSIEVLMYMIFFILCKFTSKTTFISILIVALSYYFFKINNPIMIGAFSFFIGGLTYKITIAFIKNIGTKSFFIFACVFLLISWGVIFILQVADIFSIILFGFTSIIFFLVSISAMRNDFGKKIEWLGDISYSSYLLHFPLQIIAVYLADRIGYGRDLFYSPNVFILFMLTLMAISYMSYIFIEKPSQQFIRDKFQ